MSGYSYTTYFGWRWERNPRTGRWEIFPPGGTSPCATAITWPRAAEYALSQRLHSLPVTSDRHK